MAPIGSSPRARGTGRLVHPRLGQWRFIPASAGNSLVSTEFKLGPAVHPRERGEQVGTVRWSWSHSGSSPRARGTGPSHHQSEPSLRFIPASAGNRALRSVARFLFPVHPRERGEQTAESRQTGCWAGSSPRARGTGVFSPDGLEIERFIPASAGNRCARRARRLAAPVHPRERGEQTVSSGMASSMFGSSPRARGTGRSRRSCWISLRFIPASAGNRLPGIY